MNATQFAEECPRARVILIGESHTDNRVETVLDIVKTFEDRGHNLGFYFEHFPGQPAIHTVLFEEKIAPGQFLDREQNYFENNKWVKSTPMKIWGHNEQRQKLITLMTFAQQRSITMKGHDLVQDDFSEDGYHEWQDGRNSWMVKYILNDIGKSKSWTAVGFVGKLHLEPQAKLLRETLHPGTVVTLCPDEDISDGNIEKVENSLLPDYRFKP